MIWLQLPTFEKYVLWITSLYQQGKLIFCKGGSQLTSPFQNFNFSLLVTSPCNTYNIPYQYWSREIIYKCTLLTSLLLSCVCCSAIEGEKRHHSFLSSIADFPKIGLKTTNTEEKYILPDHTSRYICIYLHAVGLKI